MLSTGTPRALRSGEVTPCIVTMPAGELVIDDTYRAEDDDASALRQVGLIITATGYTMPVTVRLATGEAPAVTSIMLTARKS